MVVERRGIRVNLDGRTVSRPSKGVQLDVRRTRARNARPCVDCCLTVAEAVTFAQSRNAFGSRATPIDMANDSSTDGRFSEKLRVPEALTFDDVLLRPAESRVEPDEA